MNNKKETTTISERVGSREAVERAIEQSKDGRNAHWEKQSQLPKWGQKREERRAASAASRRA